MIELDSIEFHSEVFHAGTNLGKKLGPGSGSRFSNVKVELEDDKSMIYLTYIGRVREFPAMSAFSWERKGQRDAPPVNEHKTESVEGRRRAQVSTPTGHVFEGKGAGKVRQ